jgi:hypothetical protein
MKKRGPVRVRPREQAYYFFILHSAFFIHSASIAPGRGEFTFPGKAKLQKQKLGKQKWQTRNVTVRNEVLESQRDSVLQPRVATTEPPWARHDIFSNPNGVASPQPGRRPQSHWDWVILETRHLVSYAELRVVAVRLDCSPHRRRRRREESLIKKRRIMSSDSCPCAGRPRFLRGIEGLWSCDWTVPPSA